MKYMKWEEVKGFPLLAVQDSGGGIGFLRLILFPQCYVP